MLLDYKGSLDIARKVDIMNNSVKTITWMGIIALDDQDRPVLNIQGGLQYSGHTS